MYPRRSSAPSSRPDAVFDRGTFEQVVQLVPNRYGPASMLAVYASSISRDDPLGGLVVGERPNPERPKTGRP